MHSWDLDAEVFGFAVAALSLHRSHAEMKGVSHVFPFKIYLWFKNFSSKVEHRKLISRFVCLTHVGKKNRSYINFILNMNLRILFSQGNSSMWEICSVTFLPGVRCEDECHSHVFPLSLELELHIRRTEGNHSPDSLWSLKIGLPALQNIK